MITDILIAITFWTAAILAGVFFVVHGQRFRNLFKPVLNESRSDADWNYVKKVFEPYDPAVLDTSEWKRISDTIVKHKETGVEIWIGHVGPRYMEKWKPRRDSDMRLNQQDRRHVYNKLSEVV